MTKYNTYLKTAYEKISDINKLVSEEEIINAIQNAPEGIKKLLAYGFHPNVKWSIPEGNPPLFNKKETNINERDVSSFVLEKDVNYFEMYMVQSGLTQLKKEQKFLELCEACHPDDVKLLVAVKDKTLPTLFENITLEMTKTALPQYLGNF